MPKLRDVPSSDIEDRRWTEGDPVSFMFRNPRVDFSLRLPSAVPSSEDVGELGRQAGFEDVGSKPQFMKPEYPAGISSAVWDALEGHSDEVRDRMNDLIARKNRSMK